METSRRNMLRYLLMAPASVALQRLSAQAQERPRAVAGYLNLYLEGPFSFVYLPAQKSVLILAPITSQHHEPSFTSEMDEKVVIKTYDYALVGPTPATQPTWIYPNQAIQVNRLLIPSAAIGMDQGGTIDKGKKRYFSLRVPNPNTITPWHPVNVTVTARTLLFLARRCYRLDIHSAIRILLSGRQGEVSNRFIQKLGPQPSLPPESERRRNHSIDDIPARR